MKTPGSGLRKDNPAWPLLDALISYWDTTDNAGLAAGTTLRCGGLANEPSYVNHAVKIITGPSAGQQRDIVTHVGDTLTVSTAFSNPAGAPQQITAGVIFIVLSTSLPAISEIHGVFTVLPCGPNICQPDTFTDLSLSISTVNGIPLAAQLTVGTISITRVRLGGETPIVVAAACLATNGRIYYNYTFPSASWMSGDEYKAVFSGQSVAVDATTYALSDIRLKGLIANSSTFITLDIFHEQVAVPVSVNASSAGLTNILLLPVVAGRHYRVLSLRLKCADPIAETVTVSLSELVNSGLIVVQIFTITHANYLNYFSLMDIFGLTHLSGDNLRVTVTSTGAANVAVTGQYSLSQTG